jgi:hypothetical protein
MIRAKSYRSGRLNIDDDLKKRPTSLQVADSAASTNEMLSATSMLFRQQKHVISLSTSIRPVRNSIRDRKAKALCRHFVCFDTPIMFLRIETESCNVYQFKTIFRPARLKHHWILGNKNTTNFGTNISVSKAMVRNPSLSISIQQLMCTCPCP